MKYLSVNIEYIASFSGYEILEARNRYKVFSRFCTSYFSFGNSVNRFIINIFNEIAFESADCCSFLGIHQRPNIVKIDGVFLLLVYKFADSVEIGYELIL